MNNGTDREEQAFTWEGRGSWLSHTYLRCCNWLGFLLEFRNSPSLFSSFFVFLDVDYYYPPARESLIPQIKHRHTLTLIASLPFPVDVDEVVDLHTHRSGVVGTIASHLNFILNAGVCIREKLSVYNVK